MRQYHRNMSLSSQKSCTGFRTARIHESCYSLYVINAEDTDLQIVAHTRFISDFCFCSEWEGSCKLVNCDFTSELSFSADQEILDLDSGISSMLSVILLSCL